MSGLEVKAGSSSDDPEVITSYTAVHGQVLSHSMETAVIAVSGMFPL